jgi:glucan biosynthesis protein C
MHSQARLGHTDSASRHMTRVYYLDWLRVLAILTVFIFHCGRFFDQEEWHVKNPVTYFGAEVWTYFLAGWLMPLIFVISGASIFYALGKGGVGKFVKDRTLRLLVPLVVGACTHIAFQVYMEYRFQYRFNGTFLAFLPRYFHGFRDFGGNFAWTGIHLWYLLALFLFSLIFLPLFLWLKGGSGKRLLSWLGGFLAKPGAVYLLAVPGTLLIPYLDPDRFLTSRDWGGWGLPLYVPYFLAGFLFVSHEGLQARIRRQRWWSLAAGVACFGAMLGVALTQEDPVFGTRVYSLFYSLFSLFSWSFMLAILGFGMQHLTFNTRFLPYANEAVLPFYILHQTVIVSVGFYVVRWPIPDLLKFVIIAASSFAIIMLLYECLIRRVNVLRFLFGMKPLRKAAAAQTEEATLVGQSGSTPTV